MFKVFCVITALIFLPKQSFSAPTKSENQYKSAIKYTLEEEEEFNNFSEEEREVYDPYEKTNRKIFAFNETLDRYFFEYVAKAYRYSIPPIARKIVRNFLNNLTLPISGLNSLAQGKVDNGLATFSNFLINTTIGIGGLFDVASEKGINYRLEDFGQTLGNYDLNYGSYLVIPFLGASSTRDFSGWIVDKSINPLGFNALEFGGRINLLDSHYRLGLGAASAIDTRENFLDILDDIRRDSFDPYATIRSAYIQKRITEIKN